VLAAALPGAGGSVVAVSARTELRSEYGDRMTEARAVRTTQNGI
jgi:hypothetical protein